MDNKPIASLDTSAINRLTDDPDRASLLPNILGRFDIRLSFTVASELVATKDAPRRSNLLAVCKELMHSGDCIHNAYNLLRILISAFEGSQNFDWQRVDVRCQEAEDILRSGSAFDDGESQSMRDENKEDKCKFEEFYRLFTHRYNEAFAQPGATRPASLSESVERFRQSRSFDKMASVLYAYIAGRDPRREHPPATTVKHFLRSCPPFQAYLLGLCAARYTRNLKPTGLPSMRAGALDTSMTVCLPYCSVFVTNDIGMQNCFKEIGTIATFPAEVLSYDCFRRRFDGPSR